MLDGGKLKVIKTPNAVNPLAQGQIALLTCDVWEHAYYLDFQNRRPDFVESFLDHLVNWDYVARAISRARARECRLALARRQAAGRGDAAVLGQQHVVGAAGGAGIHRIDDDAGLPQAPARNAAAPAPCARRSRAADLDSPPRASTGARLAIVTSPIVRAAKACVASGKTRIAPS